MSRSSVVVSLRELRQSCVDCALNTLCLPASIGMADLDRLDSVIRQRLPLDRGETLFREGAHHQSLFVVRSGSLKTFVTLPEGDTQVLGFHIAGEMVGFDGLGGDGHRCTAVALERSSLCEVPLDKLADIAPQVPGLQLQLFRIMSREFTREQQHPVMMGRKQAMSRLAIFLRSLSERLEAIGHDPRELHLSMSRQELANYLGLVIETVSRGFTRLQSLGILRVERRSVHILDPAGLAMLSERSERSDDEATRESRA